MYERPKECAEHHPVPAHGGSLRKGPKRERASSILGDLQGPPKHIGPTDVNAISVNNESPTAIICVPTDTHLGRTQVRSRVGVTWL